MKVLIIVDMQYGFLVKDKYKHLIDRVKFLLNSEKYDKVIFTKFINTQDSLYVTKLGWQGLQDEKSQSLAINPNENDVVFEKFGYGCSNEMLDYIKSLKINEIDICGLQTDACVYAIALNMFDIGIFPNILINYTMTNNQDLAKSILLHQFGHIDERI